MIKPSSITRTISGRLNAALTLPHGARFYRCALQVNPFVYLNKNSKQTSFVTETDYNAAIIAACQEAGVEVLGVTDHYNVADSKSLVTAARAAGLFAFSGFEAVAKDGVHFLCLFDPDKDKVLERYIGQCGVHDSASASPTGNLDSSELLAHTKDWGNLYSRPCFVRTRGLLKKLSGQTRVNVWKSEFLLACAIAGPIGDTPEGVRPILEKQG